MGEAAGLYSQDRDETGLTRRQREVLQMLQGAGGNKPMTQLAVSEKLGISRQRVRQIVVDLMSKGFEIPGAKPLTAKQQEQEEPDG